MKWIVDLRTRQMLVVALAILPLLGLVLYNAFEQREGDTARALEGSAQIVRLAAVSHERLVEGARQLLVALSRLPEVRRGIPGECDRLLGDLLRQYPLYSNFGVIALDGSLRCSALPFSGPVNLADRAYFQLAIKSRDFSIGEYQIGRVTGKATINFGCPVLDEEGTVVGVVFAALDLAWLGKFAAEAKLPPGSVLTVVDRQGNVLTRYPDGEGWTGFAGSETPLIQVALARGEGKTEALDVDGMPRLAAFATLGGLGNASVYMGIPKRGVLAEADRNLRRNLGILGIVAFLALWGAWGACQWLVIRPVKGLTRAAESLSFGELQVRVGPPYPEGQFGVLAKTFDEMAATLENRNKELERMVQETQAANRQLQALNRTVQVRLNTLFGSIAEIVEAERHALPSLSTEALRDRFASFLRRVSSTVSG
ncbi:MAG: HAMP domain-containing protein [Chloroflexi bacterium]|nr:HAMP domain-containing protein [Chloroflexota bacterium]